MTDAGLARLGELTHLTQLCFRDTPVTDAGLVHLRELANLDCLTLEGTRVTDAGVRELGLSLPNCKIYH